MWILKGKKAAEKQETTKGPEKAEPVGRTVSHVLGADERERSRQRCEDPDAEYSLKDADSVNK